MHLILSIQEWSASKAMNLSKRQHREDVLALVSVMGQEDALTLCNCIQCRMQILYSILLVADRFCRYSPCLCNTCPYCSCLQTISEDALNACKALLPQDESLTPQTTVGFAKTSSPSFIMIAMYATNVCNKHKMSLSSPYNPRCMQIFARYKALLADHSRMLRTRGIEIVHPY